MSRCTELHERMRVDPIARRLYGLNQRPWLFDDGALLIFECSRCKTTLSVELEEEVPDAA